LPDDTTLSDDLRHFMVLYAKLVSSEAQLFERADAEEDEANLGEEDLRLMREHKRIERNRGLAARAKRCLGYVCMACGFDFQAKYGELGKAFIEAHHLTPLGTLKGQKLKLDVKRDFAVLCSNCHRMIHRSNYIGEVTKFRENHINVAAGGGSG
jgi:5-methylcytosine-specific restriction protein A